MKYLVLLSTAFLLVSCTTSETPALVNTAKYVKHSEMTDLANTKIHESKIPASKIIGDDNWLTYIDDIDDFLIAYPADYPSEKPIFYSGMSIERITPPSPCSSSLTGVSKSEVLDNTHGKTVWGRFNNEEMMLGETPEAVCRPSRTDGLCNGKKISAFEYCDDGSRVYALCSEKNDKTVVICINQQTDNPEQAKQIFETFKWTD